MSRSNDVPLPRRPWPSSATPRCIETRFSGPELRATGERWKQVELVSARPRHASPPHHPLIPAPPFLFHVLPLPVLAVVAVVVFFVSGLGPLCGGASASASSSSSSSFLLPPPGPFFLVGVARGRGRSRFTQSSLSVTWSTSSPLPLQVLSPQSLLPTPVSTPT